jgi:hypothetical protein
LLSLPGADLRCEGNVLYAFQASRVAARRQRKAASAVRFFKRCVIGRCMICDDGRIIAMGLEMFLPVRFRAG